MYEALDIIFSLQYFWDSTKVLGAINNAIFLRQLE